MESLRIRNFLTIREAELEIRRFTILIGPQASGKSVIAKLLYFFRDFLRSTYLNSILAGETEDRLKQRAISKFVKIFPSYAWQDRRFEVVYRYDDVWISISHQGAGAENPQLSYSPILAQVLREAAKVISRVSKQMLDARPKQALDILLKAMEQTFHSPPIVNKFHSAIFIPSGRSFFANLQRNVFSFLVNDILIDPLIKEFGAEYETTKPQYSRHALSSGDDIFLQDEEKKEFDAVLSEIREIIAGDYVYENEQDWIVEGERRVNLAQASSGQQESLPMLIVLAWWFQTRRSTTFFIEEPEAHLFPVSQRRLVEIFARLAAARDHRFLLTTHSPYILTAINNLVMAGNLIEERGDEVREEVLRIIGGNKLVRFEDVSAYTIKDGSLESILDDESRLIGSSVIDSVSDEFESVFDRLLELQLG